MSSGETNNWDTSFQKADEKSKDSSNLTIHAEIESLKKEILRLKQDFFDKELFIDTILESTLAGYWDWNIPEDYEYLSPTFKSMFGYKDDELPNKPDTWQKLIHPDDLPGVLNVFEKHVKTKGAFPYVNEVRYLHKNGSIIWVFCLGKVIEWDIKGNPIRMVGCHVDITNLKKANDLERTEFESQKKEILRLKQDLFDKELLINSILEETLAGYWDWHITENYEYLSPTFKRMFGYEDDELPNKPESWQKLIHYDDLPGVLNVFEKHVKSKGKIPYVNEIRYFHKNGSVVWVYCVGKVIEWDAKGNPVRMVGCHIDITQLKSEKKKEKEETKNPQDEIQKLKQELSDKQILIDSILEGTLAGYWDWNIPEGYEYLSPTFKSMFGYKDDELPNNPEAWQDMLHPDDLAKVSDTFEKHIKTKGAIPYINECRYFHRNGSIIWVYCVGKVIEWDAKGNPIRMVGCHVDITKLKKAEELEKYARQLEAKNKELEQFAYVASHDLQEPLRTVNCFVNLLEQEYIGKFDEDADKYFKIISQSATRMSELVKALLDYSRIGRKRELTKIDCNALIKAIQTDLSSYISETNTIIEVGNLPNITGYKTELRLLFQNLISNAIKFRKQYVTPHIMIEAEDDDSNWIFFVKDNGIGIEEKHKHKIFMIFQRLHNKSEYEGTGIGLAHCQKIVDLHDGKIWVDSQPSEGSTFYFKIPKLISHEQKTKLYFTH